MLRFRMMSKPYMELSGNIGIILLILAWTLPWKGVALWKAARLSHNKWFIALLIINSLALLEIYYIFFVARGYNVEVEEKSEEDEVH